MSGQYPSFVARRLSTLSAAALDVLLQQNASVINGIRNGQINSTGSISLEYTGAGTRTTTVTDPLCTVNSFPYFVATNLRGSKALQQYYVDNIIAGSFDIHWDETVATVSGGNPATLRYVLLG